MKSAVICLLVLFSFLLAPAAVWSQSRDGGEPSAQNNREAFDRWQRMTPEQKQELRDRLDRWKSMPPEEKAEMQKKFERWRDMSAEEKASARKNFERWQQLSP
jgi:hypothetical protein